MATFPAWLAEMAAWLKNKSIYMYGMWDSPTPGDVNGPRGPGVPGEGGVDLGAPSGTPVYALATGVVEGAGYWKDQLHGVVTTRVNVPGAGMEDLYYQHIIIAPGIKQGMTVQKGTLLGKVGSLNETEVGFNANWGQPWGLNHPGPWIKDPRPWIAALMTETSSPGSSNGSTGSTTTPDSNSMNSNNPSSGIGIGPLTIDLSQYVTGIENWLKSAGIVVTGGIIVLLALVLIFKGSKQ